ncbi:DUF397 domain-containing protein [Streptomyces sp. R02]|uniref:DUF397 domain-containing protein n=1 Tax=Streptomyces sp. R02 TaxID=3238623 RepID=A0AB39LV69_9ACTN
MNAESQLVWFKSSYSTGDGGQCVEVAVRPHVVHVRDSKDVARPSLAVDAAAWDAFVRFAGR